MSILFVLHILGALLTCLALTLLLPIPFSYYYHDGSASAFIWASATCLIIGLTLMKLFKNKKELSVREGFAVVTFGWLVFALFGALPYLFTGAITSPLDAVFETMSGFTTTGSTILTEIESLPQSILFWRALTHWLGGNGDHRLESWPFCRCWAVGGMQLFQAEVPGPTAGPTQAAHSGHSQTTVGRVCHPYRGGNTAADGWRHEFLRCHLSRLCHSGDRWFLNPQRLGCGL